MKGLRSWLALALAVCLLWGCAAALGEEKELLTNGGFERAGAADTPDGWYSSAYRTQQGYTRFAVTGERAHSGEYSAKITNANANDARFVYPVTVEPESMYRFSAWICVEDMEDEGNGANLAIKDVYAFSDCLFDTQGEWRYLEWYGETDVGQTQVELSVCVGGYGAESVGTAYFDDVSLVKVDTLPDDVYADLWFTVNSGVSQQTETDAEETPGKSTAWFVLLALLFAALALLGRNYLLRGEGRPKSGVTLCFALALAAALVLRVALAMTVSGYSVDMNCFAAWSLRMASGGPVNFYDESVFCDYPPGYMLMLWPVGLLLRAVGYGENGVSWLIVKLLPILADMITAIALFAFAKKRLPEKAAAFVSLLFAFSPAVLVNGAAWGQADTVLSLLILLTVIYAMDRRWRVAIPLFVAAVLVKPQALLFAPLGGVWLILSLARDRQRGARIKDVLIGLGIGALCAAAIIVPFSIRQKPLWLVELYQKTLSSYDYASLNTANLAYLLGGNWSALSAENGAVTLSWALPLATALLCLAAAAWQSGVLTGGFAQRKAGLTGRLRAHQPLEQADRRFALSALLALTGLAFAVETFLPCTFLVYGATWMAVSYLWGILCLVLEPDAKKLPFFMAVTLMGVYVLGIKVHERYLFAALALLLLTYTLIRDRRVLWLMVGFSITTFLNTAIVLDNSILYGSSMGHLNADTLVLNDLLCVLNLALCGAAFGLCFAGLRETEPIAEEAPREHTAPVYRSELLTPRDAGLHMTGREWLTVCLVTAVYAVLAFTNLGSLKAPQTAWVSTSAEEQAVFELAERSTFKTLYYAGVSYNNFSISVSDDGEHWSESYPCDLRQGICYRWSYVLQANESQTGFLANKPENVLWLTGKYLRVNAESAGLNLWEIILRDENGEQLPLSFVSQTGEKDVLTQPQPASNLVDEQDTCEGEPSWFNSMYFDEVYHARTAYEHLHGIAPFETTHPPLGKLMMSAAIAVFGMTPFGWRFAGALIGVLMLPALYLLAKQLTKKRELATLAMLLFALDLMHYTQTRIATIDSFPVFFIILSYLCMARYLMMDHCGVPALAAAQKPRVLTRPFLRTLVPLALCGLFMGLGIASKWIGIYSAVGLALLFFTSCYRQYRTGLTAYEADLDGLSEEQGARVRWAREITLKRILVTCAFCVLFFVAVPAVIYYLSYIPYLSPTGPVTLKRIIAAQESMLSYHSTPGLGMDHPFQSPWWQWPFILKPMWYCQDQFEPAGYASTIMCMGNPVVFYAGAVCMAACMLLLIGKFVRVRREGVSLRHGDGDLSYGVLAVGFCAQYLPWVLVPRSMYMYHYFASVPFIILATCCVFGLIERPRLRRGLMIGFVALAAVAFVLFFPYASGVLTPTGWLDAMKWFSRLYY